MTIRFDVTDNQTHYKEWFKKLWMDLHGHPTKPATIKNLRLFEETYGVKLMRDPKGDGLHAINYIEVPDEDAAILFRLKWL